MCIVTENVKEGFKAQLQKLNMEPDVAIRLMRSPSNPNQLRMVLDKEAKGDHVVESEDGMKILLIGSDLFPALKGRVIDFREIPQGSHFRSIF